MPEISRFFGIIIRMFFDDHAPPHLHAAYGEFAAVLAIDPIRVMESTLPARALSLVIEWMALHRESCSTIGIDCTLVNPL